MDMTSNTTSNTVVPSTLQNKQEAAMVASPPRDEAAAARKNVKAKQAWQQQMAASGDGERKPRLQQERGLNCPCCDSTNTKFCYYNNNSMTQPRYFCKTCRRNWTQGGTLRKVPIGGGSRKNKQSRAGGSSSSAPPAPSSTSNDSNKMNLTQQLIMVEKVKRLIIWNGGSTTTPMPANFPNVLPSPDVHVSRQRQLRASRQSPLLPALPTIVSANTTGTIPSLVNIFRGGFSDGGMVALPFLPVPPSFGAMHQHAPGMMMGGSSDQQLVRPLQGMDRLVLKTPLVAACGSGPQQWPPTAALEQQVVGGDGHADNNNNNNNGGGQQQGRVLLARIQLIIHVIV